MYLLPPANTEAALKLVRWGFIASCVVVGVITLIILLAPDPSPAASVNQPQPVAQYQGGRETCHSYVDWANLVIDQKISLAAAVYRLGQIEAMAANAEPDIEQAVIDASTAVRTDNVRGAIEAGYALARACISYGYLVDTSN